MTGVPIMRPEWVAALRAYDPTLDVWWSPTRKVYFVTTRTKTPVPFHPAMEGSSVPRYGKYHTLHGFLFDLMDQRGNRYEPHPNIVIAFCEHMTARRGTPRGDAIWREWEPKEYEEEREPTLDEVLEQDVHREAVRDMTRRFVWNRHYVT